MTCPYLGTKLLYKNISAAKWKLPSAPPSTWEIKMVDKWNILTGFSKFDDTKLMVRKATKWAAPLRGWTKLNFNGVANNLTQGGGGVLRDHNGTCLLAYVGPLNNYTINQAEGMALLWGIELATQMNIRLLEIEGDCKVVVEAIKRRGNVGWHVNSIILEILELLNNLECKISHTYKEGNVVVDSMVAIGLRKTKLSNWKVVSELPMVTEQLIREEINGIAKI